MFLINLPLGIFIVVTAVRHVPETRDPTAGGRLDFRGAVLAALGLAGTTYALIEAPGQRRLATGPGGGDRRRARADRLRCRRAAYRQPDDAAAMFASRQFSAANAVTFVVFGALSGVFFLLVAFLQISLGYSPLAAGAASLPITALMLLLSARCGSACPTDRAEDPADRRTAGHAARDCC